MESVGPMPEGANINVARQVRRAAADIDSTLRALAGHQCGDSAILAQKARFQLQMLVEMVSQAPERGRSWSYFQPRVMEEFGEI